jgi:DNA-binding MarR family transcriptional regulator
MNSLPQSQKIVLEILGTGGEMTHKEISAKMNYSPRTVRYALKKLREKKLLIKKMNLQDMRQIIYQYPVNALQGSGKINR